MSVFQVVLVISLIVLVAIVLYYFILLAGSGIRPRKYQEPVNSESPRRFALLIPAHNEELVIGRTVKNLLQMDYDPGMFDIVVIADNCDDNTALMSREAGAICVERDTPPVGRKGFAIKWFLDETMQSDHAYDALVILDADSRPKSNLLEVMSSNLRSNRTVLQGRHVISNPEDSVFTRLADIDMRTNNRLRNLAKSNLGLSCRLMGDAMCFDWSILEKYPWGADSLVEDREYGIQLVGHGVTLAYIPKAISHGQAAGGWSQAKSQRLRWTGGVMDLRRKYAVDLLRRGFKNRNWSAIDQSIELLMPPFSFLLAIASFLLLVQIPFSSIRFTGSLWISITIIIAFFLVPVVSLIMDGAPLGHYPYVFFGPVYALWRNWINLLSLLRPNEIRWIRTERSEES